AAEGYFAVAPAIFEHVEPNFETGYDAHARTRSMAIAGKIDREQLLRDVAAAIDVAKRGGKVAIVGFCLGGTVAGSAAGSSGSRTRSRRSRPNWIRGRRTSTFQSRA